MGVWLFFKGHLDFNKEMPPELKEEVNDYVKNESWKDENAPYGTMCPWKINDKNQLTIEAVKFGDHIVWLKYLFEHFFKPEGYSIEGVLDCRWEGESEDASSPMYIYYTGF